MAYWNVNVWKPLHHQHCTTAFIVTTLSGSDVIFIGEAGHHPPPPPPGYHRVGAARPPAGAPRGSGRGRGLFAFVRDSLASRCSIEASSGRALWLRVRAGAGAAGDLFLCGAYMPPEGGEGWAGSAPEAAFEALRAQVLQYQQQGLVLLLGDFNAKTGREPDVRPDADGLLELVGLAGATPAAMGIPLARDSPDQAPPDRFGKLLIDTLCLPCACVILNGRTPASPTCSNNGWTREHERAGRLEQSCIDYAVADARLFPHVSSFDILAHRGFSDHNALRCSLELPPPPAVAPAALGAASAPRPRFDESKRDDYVARLSGAEARLALAGLSSQDGPAAAAALARVIYEAATGAFGAARPRRQPAAARRSRPWSNHCRRFHYNLQDSLYHRLDPDEARRWRNQFNRQKRKDQRHALARRNPQLLHDLRHRPRRFWGEFKAAGGGGGCGGSGHTPDEASRYWEGRFGGLGRGGLAELGAAGPRHLAEALAAESGREGLGPERLEAAAALNVRISEAEVSAQLRRLRGGAAAGIDGLGADLLKGAWRLVDGADGRQVKENVLAGPLAAAFNRAFTVGYPEAWNEQPLTAVFKGKGSESDLDNYRPIQVQAAIAKLFHMVLHARLSAFAESQGLRAEGQAGFRDGRGTVDHIYVLRHLIDRARLAGGPGRRLFACFVDLEGAYDNVRRDALIGLLASMGVDGPMLATIASMYWRVRVRPKLGAALGPAFESTCGVRQGDPLSPLLFGLFIDRVEAALAERAPEAGAELPGGGLLRVLLYADDLVLLSHDAAGLQALLDALHAFCSANHMRVNISKTEVVVFGARTWRPPPTGAPWHYAGAPLPLSPAYKYLGITLHSTRGMSAAMERLRSAGLRAIWGMHSRCKHHGIGDFAIRARLFTTLARPILAYGSEVWGPDCLQSVDYALKSPLQVLQNDYVRHLGGLRRSTPAAVLCAESCLAPLGRVWLAACARLWNRLLAAPAGSVIRRALEGDLTLALSLPPPKARRTWAGAWLHALGWLSREGGPRGQSIGDHLSTVTQAAAAAAAGQPAALAALSGSIKPGRAADAWDEALKAHVTGRAAASPAGAHATYLECFAATRAEHRDEPGFPPEMPEYFRHTTRFNSAQAARALMRLRCCSTPFAACPTLHSGVDPVCTRCAAGVPETAEHALLDCPAYADLRDQPRYAPLFEAPLPQQRRMRAFAHQHRQRLLGEFVHACFERRTAPPPPPAADSN